MATAKVFAAATDAWVDVIGAAAGVTGVTWQCVGTGTLLIAFTTAAPAGGPTDAVHELRPGQSYTDWSGSSHCWIKRSGRGAASISATAE